MSRPNKLHAAIAFAALLAANSLRRGDHLRTGQAGSGDDGLQIDTIQQRQKQKQSG